MESKKIDYEAITAGTSPERKRRIAQEQIRRVGYVAISDALVNRDRDSIIVLQVLDAMSESGALPLYKLKIVRDAQGNPPVHGEIYQWKWQVKTRDDFGTKYDTRKINEMLRRGDDDHVVYHAAKIDKDGCITIPYKDAAMLLANHGIHYESRMPISGMREHSRDPVVTESGQRHTWNWLYMEVPPWTSSAGLESTKKKSKPMMVDEVQS